MSAGLTRLAGLAGFGLLLVVLGTSALGGFGWLEAEIAGAQRGFRDALAGTLRALRGGDSAAVWALLGLAFGYGVLHAAGPGHGKVLIGGYGVGRRVALRRLMVLAVLASLAQATVAVVVVHGGLGLLGMTRDAVGAAGDGWMAALGHVAMAGIGAWLIWRGVRGLRRLMPGQVSGADHHHDHADHGNDHHAQHHDHHGHDHAACDVCGHSHGPDLAQAESVTSLREAAALIAGIAVRPCSGALLLLVLTWQLGLVWTGILAAYAMGAGTALVTVGVAVLAVTGREGAWTGLPGLARTRAALPLVELAAGAVLAGVALSLLWRLG